MVKEVFDRSAALLGLLLLAPLLLVVAFAVWYHDHHSPFYLGRRAGRHGSQFRMLKIRSMVADAGRLGGNATAADDSRITPIGRFIRRWKIDEISQLLNVLRGDMSLVGPRPQDFEEVTTFTPQEQELLAVKPGITDFASIVFADEGEILRGAPDPCLAYRQLIRPWKSRLGLFYVAHHSFSIDLQLILLTLVRIFAPDRALDGVGRLLQRLGATAELVSVARRRTSLAPHALPGMSEPFGA
jgi:lipopolysaccharide/colanic/teichoic acid biosynthesis glycosyltransferase